MIFGLLEWGVPAIHVSSAWGAIVRSTLFFWIFFLLETSCCVLCSPVERTEVYLDWGRRSWKSSHFCVARLPTGSYERTSFLLPFIIFLFAAPIHQILFTGILNSLASPPLPIKKMEISNAWKYMQQMWLIFSAKREDYNFNFSRS